MQVVLIRHAHSQANAKGILSGRIAGICLSETGLLQAQNLITRLGALKVAQLRISPLERCGQTINPWWQSVGQETNPSVKLVEDEILSRLITETGAEKNYRFYQ